MNLRQRNQLLMDQQEAREHLVGIYRTLLPLRNEIKKLESKYSQWWNVYERAERKLFEERVKYIPRGRSGTLIPIRDPIRAAVVKFAAMSKKDQLKLLATLETKSKDNLGPNESPMPKVF